MFTVSPNSFVGRNNDLECRSSEVNWTDGNRPMDQTIVCSPGDASLMQTPTNVTNNTWLDGDADQYICENLLGHTWTGSGHSTDANRLANGNPVPFFNNAVAEYPQSKARLECCGDDGENLVTATCDGSTSSTALCAPNDGKNYKISNGDLVEENSCPDITRSPPVFLQDSYVAGNWNTFDNFLTTNNYGYCCDGGRSGDPNYPLCNAGSADGCFISNESLSLSLQGSTEWCVQSGTDQNCVVDGSLLQSSAELKNLTFLSNNLRASTAVRYDAIGKDDYICTQYNAARGSIVYQGSTCNVENCEAVNVTTCSPTENFSFLEPPHPGPVSNCYARCETLHGQGAPFISCTEQCASYTCTTEEVYYGNSCDIPAGCEKSVEVEVVDVDPNSVSNCFAPSNYYQCQVGTACAFAPPPEPMIVEDEPSVVEGSVHDPSTQGDFLTYFIRLEEINVSFIDEFNPQSGVDYCVPHGTQVNDSGNLLVCGDALNTQNFGDYWCPPGYEYNDGIDTCVPEEDICQAGPVGTNSCADITNPGNDTYFNAYESGCVEKTAGAPGSADVYDETCCLDAVFNDFEIYGMDVGNVKVY